MCNGFVNLILWAKTFERWRHVATTSSMLVAHGKVEREGDVVYVIPDRLERLELYDVPAMSRDFSASSGPSRRRRTPRWGSSPTRQARGAGNRPSPGR